MLFEYNSNKSLSPWVKLKVDNAFILRMVIVTVHSPELWVSQNCIYFFKFVFSSNKDGGLIRQLSSNAKPTFYSCTVSCQTLPLPEGTLHHNWSTADCFVYYRTGWVIGNNLHYLRFVLSSHQVDCTRKNQQLRDLTLLIKSLAKTSKQESLISQSSDMS